MNRKWLLRASWP